ncbi:MAG: 2-amino-4-hydroxy-6-hydroxymethyldihydropteridine diphosphokinase [Betaproteobacteria bacterium]|nr:2-amino-4-hydroxy-6-hydroxymethyldihydropteridine diphosphokinase [Betaproteobacteria bacterium]MDH5221013.1 2-amino-4-hydroxy-6-hydroxymethyldihydropteridine diphosphokinase [Betaproteobacteria bacterium]MDH5350288.1 2-amino-4-hydroxy-6-hydroxymethyldihydropteridine diphosphokinase [Betaproteobacteria bacterium]
MTAAYIGLGSNLDEPRAQLERAFEELAALPQSRLVARSPLYRSAPVGAPGPDFVNAVAELDTQLSAAQLLDGLQAIETRHARQRPARNAPRTLDLDLLLYDEMALASPTLTLPHPRMHLRAFVLRPLLELDPRAEIPGRGSARELLRACAGQAIERLDD